MLSIEIGLTSVSWSLAAIGNVPQSFESRSMCRKTWVVRIVWFLYVTFKNRFSSLLNSIFLLDLRSTFWHSSLIFVDFSFDPRTPSSRLAVFIWNSQWVHQSCIRKSRDTSLSTKCSNNKCHHHYIKCAFARALSVAKIIGHPWFWLADSFHQISAINWH